MKMYQKYPTRKGGRRRRHLEFRMLVPIKVKTDWDAWVDSLTDDELGDVIGPSLREITGRNADYLIPDHSESAP